MKKETIEAPAGHPSASAQAPKAVENNIENEIHKRVRQRGDDYIAKRQQVFDKLIANAF